MTSRPQALHGYKRIVCHLDKPDEFAEVIEKIDNLRGALEIPMPAGFHVNQMKRELEEVSDKLKRIYVEEEDENPWEE